MNLDLDLFIIKLENDCDKLDISIDENTYSKILMLITRNKKCIKCKVVKHFDDMCKTSNQCISCYNEYLKEYMRKRYKKSQKVTCDRTLPRVCKYCNINKQADQFYKNSRYVCIDCFKIRNKTLYAPARKAKRVKVNEANEAND